MSFIVAIFFSTCVYSYTFYVIVNGFDAVITMYSLLPCTVNSEFSSICLALSLRFVYLLCIEQRLHQAAFILHLIIV